jgi:LAO/AO transport system kinase
MTQLVTQLLKGESTALARLITLVENNSPQIHEVMKTIHGHTGTAHIIGVTGTMGTGKSTLIGAVTRAYRKQDKTVGIVGIDPTSWFSGGALLGDRIRMQDLATDPGVFIRSMGSRGVLGGLTASIYDVVALLDASGKDIVIVETVGVGQSEIDIAKMADTTVVVTVPGLGDSIQALKAGITEIADIFVVNKADQPGADEVVLQIQQMLDIDQQDEWQIPVIAASASEGRGILDVTKFIDIHMDFLTQSHRLTKRRITFYESQLLELIKKRLMHLILDESRLKETIAGMIEKIFQKDMDPHSAAENILKHVLK